MLRVLTLVGEFPVGAVEQYRALAGEAAGGKATEQRFETLKERGLVEVVARRAWATARQRLPKGAPMTLSRRGQGADRYALTKAGRTAFCNFHGGKPKDLRDRGKLGRLQTELKDGRVEDRWPYRHEDLVFDVLAQSAQRGCPIAPGWQARTNLADGRRSIDPDAKVLAQTPWGRSWCFMEVELSDTSPGDLKPRCEKYGSPERRDDHPVLFICPDGQAERNLHQAGLEVAPDARILTTTLCRLKKHGVFGAGAWSHYGEPVTLAALGS